MRVKAAQPSSALGQRLSAGWAKKKKKKKKTPHQNKRKERDGERRGTRVAHGPVKTRAPEEAILETSCVAPTPIGPKEDERPHPSSPGQVAPSQHGPGRDGHSPSPRSCSPPRRSCRQSPGHGAGRTGTLVPSSNCTHDRYCYYCCRYYYRYRHRYRCHLPPARASQTVSRSSAKWRLRSVCARHRAGGGAGLGPPVTKEAPPAGQRARLRQASRGPAAHAQPPPRARARSAAEKPGCVGAPRPLAPALGGAPPRERAGWSSRSVCGDRPRRSPCEGGLSR